MNNHETHTHTHTHGGDGAGVWLIALCSQSNTRHKKEKRSVRVCVFVCVLPDSWSGRFITCLNSSSLNISSRHSQKTRQFNSRALAEKFPQISGNCLKEPVKTSTTTSNSLVISSRVHILICQVTIKKVLHREIIIMKKTTTLEKFETFLMFF